MAAARRAEALRWALVRLRVVLLPPLVVERPVPVERLEVERLVLRVDVLVRRAVLRLVLLLFWVAIWANPSSTSISDG